MSQHPQTYAAHTDDPAATTGRIAVLADKHAISVQAAARLADIDRQIADVRSAFEPIDSPVPWRSTVNLGPACSEPWNDDHYHRDRLRWQTAQEHIDTLRQPQREPLAEGVNAYGPARRGVDVEPLPDLIREDWSAYAERGQDPVADRLTELCDAAVDELERFRHVTLSEARHAAEQDRERAREAQRIVDQEDARRREAARQRAEAQAGPMRDLIP